MKLSPLSKRLLFRPGNEPLRGCAFDENLLGIFLGGEDREHHVGMGNLENCVDARCDADQRVASSGALRMRQCARSTRRPPESIYGTPDKSTMTLFKDGSRSAD